jgi:hypothetical protein
LLRLQSHNIDDRNDHGIGGPSEDPASHAVPEPELLKLQIGLLPVILQIFQEKKERDVNQQHKGFGAHVIHIKHAPYLGESAKEGEYGWKVRSKKEDQRYTVEEVGKNAPGPDVDRSRESGKEFVPGFSGKELVVDQQRLQ